MPFFFLSFSFPVIYDSILSFLQNLFRFHSFCAEPLLFCFTTDDATKVEPSVHRHIVQEVVSRSPSRCKKSSQEVVSKSSHLFNTCTLLSNTRTLYCIIILYFIIITGATLSASASGRKFPTVICASPRTLDHDPETWLPQDNTRARECIWPVTNSHTQLHPKRLP